MGFGFIIIVLGSVATAVSRNNGEETSYDKNTIHHNDSGSKKSDNTSEGNEGETENIAEVGNEKRITKITAEVENEHTGNQYTHSYEVPTSNINVAEKEFREHLEESDAKMISDPKFETTLK
ncbi:hypothetical protein LC1Hm_1984 [Halomicrobium sp. LC1Hm]|nr:hypothetical protein LC1Hm_1984 [Halomicrobium sp. LC1Hm]